MIYKKKSVKFIFKNNIDLKQLHVAKCFYEDESKLATDVVFKYYEAPKTDTKDSFGVNKDCSPTFENWHQSVEKLHVSFKISFTMVVLSIILTI